MQSENLEKDSIQFALFKYINVHFYISWDSEGVNFSEDLSNLSVAPEKVYGVRGVALGSNPEEE